MSQNKQSLPNENYVQNKANIQNVINFQNNFQINFQNENNPPLINPNLQSPRELLNDINFFNSFNSEKKKTLNMIKKTNEKFREDFRKKSISKKLQDKRLNMINKSKNENFGNIEMIINEEIQEVTKEEIDNIHDLSKQLIALINSNQENELIVILKKILDDFKNNLNLKDKISICFENELHKSVFKHLQNNNNTSNYILKKCELVFLGNLAISFNESENEFYLNVLEIVTSMIDYSQMPLMDNILFLIQNILATDSIFANKFYELNGFYKICNYWLSTEDTENVKTTFSKDILTCSYCNDTFSNSVFSNITWILKYLCSYKDVIISNENILLLIKAHKKLIENLIKEEIIDSNSETEKENLLISLLESANYLFTLHNVNKFTCEINETCLIDDIFELFKKKNNTVKEKCLDFLINLTLKYPFFLCVTFNQCLETCFSLIDEKIEGEAKRKVFKLISNFLSWEEILNEQCDIIIEKIHSYLIKNFKFDYSSIIYEILRGIYNAVSQEKSFELVLNNNIFDFFKELTDLNDGEITATVVNIIDQLLFIGDTFGNVNILESFENSQIFFALENYNLEQAFIVS